MTGNQLNDTLIGTLAGTSTPQVDQLTGGAGADLFVIGDSQSSFYRSQAFNDYAHILDFDSSSDLIQLNGSLSYITADSSQQGLVGTGLFIDSDRNGQLGSSDELIAVLSNNNSPVNLTRNNLRFV